MYVPLLASRLAALNPDFAKFAAVVAAVGGVLLPLELVALIAGLGILIAAAPGEIGEETEPNCNSRDLTMLGITLVNELMDRHMMIDVDHSDAVTLDHILDIAEQRKYPGIVSGHTGLLGAAMTKGEAIPILVARGESYDAGTTGRHEGTKTDLTVQRIIDLGGSISLALAQGGRARIRDYDPNDQVPFNCGGSSQTLVGHITSVAHPYVVGYAVCPLYDPLVTKKAGSTVPIKLRLCDAVGANLSVPSIVVHAVGVTRTGSNTPAALEDSGNANPDFDFRYDAALGGYIFNLGTVGFSPGTYMLSFVAGGDPTTHAAAFAVR